MALAETIYKPRFKGATIGDLTAVSSFLLSVIGLGYGLIHGAKVQEEASLLYPPIASEEDINKAKVTIASFGGQIWDLIDLGETTIQVPSSIREARNLLNEVLIREIERKNYIDGRSRPHIND